MWPWRRHSAELADVERRERESERQNQAADDRRRIAEQLAARSRANGDALRRQLELNGFTELITQAMRKREA